MISRSLLNRWRSLRDRERVLVDIPSFWDLSVLLVFPNAYSVGVSNLGFQTLFRMLNVSGFLCDVLYLPDDPVIAEIEAGCELVSFYTERTPAEFDVIAFTVSFENDLLNVVNLLKMMRIPPLSSEREDHLPLIIGGGVVPSANPEPFAVLFDVIYLGEAEENLIEVLKLYAHAPSKKSFLSEVSNYTNVYVPSKVEVDEGYFCVPRMQKRRAVWEEFPRVGNRSSIISPDSIFGEACILEVSRGCPRRCKFCLSSHLYRPVRFADKEVLSLMVDNAPVEKIGLLGTSVSDHKGIPHLLKQYPEKSFSFSSIRVDADESFFDALVRSGAKTLTLGIEAATYRLRRYIGKDITDEMIFDRIGTYGDAFQILKLYFMVGLPTETEEDIEAFETFVFRIRELFKGRISVSIAPFVPKPLTPFERVNFAGLGEIKSRIRRIRRLFSGLSGVFVNYELPKWSQTQAIISRGDRRVGLYYAGNLRNLPKEIFLNEIPSHVRLPWEGIR